MDALAKIEQILNLKIGLNTVAIGQSAILSAIDTRMLETRISELSTYAERIEFDDLEMNALIEECVVPETWFFRDNNSFEYLATQLPALLAKYNSRLNILSMPCSTGEEPYSIAITLLEAGLSPDNFSITAVDISEIALAAAQQAKYSEYSFRGIQNTNTTRKYFDYNNSTYSLKSNVKRQVQFQKLNIVDIAQDYKNQYYNIIFCRNLLIYFDAEQKKIAYNNIYNMMAPGGLLVMGHAESASTPSRLFKSHKTEKSYSFTCRRQGDYENEQSQKTGSKAKKSLTLNSARRRTHGKPFAKHLQTHKNVTPSNIIDNAAKNEKPPQLALENAKLLADQGLFEQATTICNEFIKDNDINDEAWYLLGLISDSQGDVNKSEECFRKAIYLNPRHYEALVHLSLLLKNNGNEVAAKQFMQRASRVNNASSPLKSTKS